VARPKKTLQQQIHDILEKYIDDAYVASSKAIDKGAQACKEKVMQDSPVSKKIIKRRTKITGNALVESKAGKKRYVRGGDVKVFKPGYYRDGWKVQQDKDLKGTLVYGKRIKNTRQPHLTHLLENGHVLKDQSGKPIGEVEKKPHIEANGEYFSKLVQDEIDDVLKKGRKIKI
jgi:hypothetical protein